jgi:hypothetical protein
MIIRQVVAVSKADDSEMADDSRDERSGTA